MKHSEKEWTRLKQAHLQLQTALKHKGGEIKIYNNAFCQGEKFLEILFYLVHYLEEKNRIREKEKEENYVQMKEWRPRELLLVF